MPIEVVFLDCDGTITPVRSSWEYLHRGLGLWDNNAEHYQRMFLEGRIDYGEFCRLDALLWRGLPVAAAKRIVTEIPYREGARQMVCALRELGIETIIISAGLSLLVERARAELGIDCAVSNELVEEGGLLTGEIRINVQHDGKGRLVRQLLGARGLRKESACAVGDGEGDIGMFQEVGLAIGFHPKDNILPFVGRVVPGGSLLETVEIIKGGGSA